MFATLDPPRDTLPLLRQYLAAFDPDFLGLRGTAEMSQRLAWVFDVVYERSGMGANYHIDHTALSHVLEPAGSVVFALSNSMPADQCAAKLGNFLGSAGTQKR